MHHWLLNTADFELVTVPVSVEILRELINSSNLVASTKRVNLTAWVNLITSQVVVANELLSWLVYIPIVWQFLSSQQKGERITAIVGAMGLSDLNSVISQVVVDNVWEILANSEEPKDLIVVVQELLLRSNLATTKALFEVLKEFNISLWRDWDA